MVDDEKQIAIQTSPITLAESSESQRLHREMERAVANYKNKRT